MSNLCVDEQLRNSIYLARVAKSVYLLQLPTLRPGLLFKEQARIRRFAAFQRDADRCVAAVKIEAVYCAHTF
jgi:hypothetical protein